MDSDAFVETVPGTRVKVFNQLVTGRRSLVLPGPWESRFLHVMERERIDSLSLNQAHGWDGETSFLRDLPINGLHILWRKSPLARLPLPLTLEDVVLDANLTSDAEIDLPSGLRTIRMSWQPPLAKLIDSSKQLTLLHVAELDDTALVSLTHVLPASLRQLEIAESTITTIGPLNMLRCQLAELRLIALRRCRDFQLRDGVAWDELRLIEVDGCIGFREVDSLGGASTLSELILRSCRNVTSLAPLARFPALQILRVLGSTNVEDGDFSVLLSSPQLRTLAVTTWRSHYHPSKGALRRRLQILD